MLDWLAETTATDVGVTGGVAAAVVALMTAATKWFGRNHQSGHRPGEAVICRQHGEDLAGLKEHAKGVGNTLERMQRNLEAIQVDIKDISRRLPPRAK